MNQIVEEFADAVAQYPEGLGQVRVEWSEGSGKIIIPIPIWLNSQSEPMPGIHAMNLQRLPDIEGDLGPWEVAALARACLEAAWITGAWDMAFGINEVSGAHFWLWRPA